MWSCGGASLETLTSKKNNAVSCSESLSEIICAAAQMDSFIAWLRCRSNNSLFLLAFMHINTHTVQSIHAEPQWWLYVWNNFLQQCSYSLKSFLEAQQKLLFKIGNSSEKNCPSLMLEYHVMSHRLFSLEIFKCFYFLLAAEFSPVDNSPTPTTHTLAPPHPD